MMTPLKLLSMRVSDYLVSVVQGPIAGCFLLRFSWMLVVGLLLPLEAHADNGPKYSNSFSSQLWYFQDETKALMLSDVITPETQAQFERNTQTVFSRGVTDSAFWFKVVISSSPGHIDSDGQVFLEVDYPWISELSFYRQEGENRFRTVNTGYTQEFKSRPLSARGFVFPVDVLLADNESGTGETIVYFRAVMSGQTVFPLRLHSEEQYRVSSIVYSMGIAAFYGISTLR